MKTKDLISIIIPVYNVEKYLNECLDSVARQKYSNLEIILVNDGSTDNSKEICENFCKRDSRFILINKENGGLSSARNVGLDNFKGDYLAFIDSDDIVSENYISDLYEVIKKYNCDIAISGYKRFNDSVPCPISLNKVVELSSNMVIKKILYQSEQEVFSVSACSKLYSKKIFSDIRYPENKINEDVAVFVPIFEKCSKVVCIYNYNYFYRVNVQSITNQKFNLKRMDAIEFSENILKHYEENKYMKKAAINMFFRRNIEVLSEMKKDRYSSQKLKSKLISNIKKYRKNVLLDLKSKASTKAAAIGSYISIELVLNFRNKLK